MAQIPTVSMLWETTTASDALKKRFGFPTAAAAGEWVVGAVADDWELPVEACDRIVISSWNALAWIRGEGRPLIVKWSAFPARFPRLRETAAVTSWLAARGVPVAAPIPSTDGRLLVEMPNGARSRLRSRLPLPGSRFLVGVLPVLPGELLDVADPVQVAQAGEMLAAVHEALATYPHPFEGRRPEASEQLVHNDFRSANVLHDGTRVTGVLDLEEATIGTRAADLARAAVMLGTRYRDWAPTTPDVRARFIDSYSARLPLTSSDRSQLEAGITAVLAEPWWASHAAAAARTPRSD